MRLIRQVGSAALGVACLAATARSQASSGRPTGTSGGSMGGGMAISSRVQVSYSQMYLDSAGNRTDWMQYFIVWRGQPGWQSASAAANDADQAAGLREYEAARVAAAVANRGFFGSGGAAPYWGEIDNRNRHLYLLGQEFALPPRGSALVVLIDRIDRVGGPPIVAASAVIDGQLPPEVRSRTWTSGDTTFTIRPSRTGTDVFLETLKQDPAIAAFLAETPRSIR